MIDENVFKLNIESELEGARLDAGLASNFNEVSRSFLAKLIEGGCVEVNGKVETSKKYKLKLADEVVVNIPEVKALDIKAENVPLDIVYEDEDLLVVHKPKGMVVHPAVGNYEGTLVNAIMYHCGDSLSSINGVARPGIVHRIDKDTSGLLMVAKNDFAHNSLASQLAEHSITRAYRAIVFNGFSEDEGTVDLPIGRDPKNRLRQAVIPMVHGELVQGSRRAVTHYTQLEKLGRFSYIEARLETGRTHQIRVHMAHIGHPLLGDDVYGPKKSPFNTEGQVLHAKLLGFVHPRTGEYMEFDSELPESFTKILNKLRMDK